MRAGCSSSMQLPLPTGTACAVSQPSSLSLNQAVAAQLVVLYCTL